MKTFQEFIQEDFNSPKATQFKIPVSVTARPTPGGKTTDIMVFYESMPYRSFNLIRYMKSFESSDAKEILNNAPGRWRGLVFGKDTELLVFVWNSSFLHANICNSLDIISKTGKCPIIGYKKSYNAMNLIDPGDTIPRNWCFPFVYISGKVRTNLYKNPLIEFESQKDIKSLFQFNENEFGDLLKSDI